MLWSEAVFERSDERVCMRFYFQEECLPLVRTYLFGIFQRNGTGRDHCFNNSSFARKFGLRGY